MQSTPNNKLKDRIPSLTPNKLITQFFSKNETKSIERTNIASITIQKSSINFDVFQLTF